MKMLLEINKDIKDKDEFIKNYLNENNLTEEDLFITVKEEKKGLLKNVRYDIEIVKRKDIIDFVKEFIDSLGKAFNTEIKSEVNFNEDILMVKMFSDTNAILIGKNGKNMNAIQVLLRQAINVNTNLNLKLNIDISNYKAKKINNLEYQVKKIAKEVLKTKVEAKLDPMNSYERRAIHNLINSMEGLETESVGEEPNRCIIIRVTE